MTETPQQDRVNTQALRDIERLRRSTTDRKVAGVAGGLGRHLNIDPTVLRVLFVVLCFFGGAGFVLYGAAWLLIPEDGHDDATVSTPPATRTALLLGAAVVALFLLVGDSWGGFGFPWPLAILALIVFVILMNRDKPVHTAPTPWSRSPADHPETPAGAPVGTAEPGYEMPQPPVPPWTPAAGPSYQAPVPPRPSRGPNLFGVTIALLAVALGVLGMIVVSGVHVVDSAYPALALAVIGVMLVVGAWIGRAGGLLPLGIVAAIVLAGTSVSNPSWNGDRQIDATPASAAAVKDNYSVPAGSVYVDLRNVSDPENRDGRTIALDANAGQLVVVLPKGVSADVQANVDVAGNIDVPGRSTDGLGLSVDQHVPAAGTETANIDLELDLVVGDIQVRQ
jgi:phage shock protein PspC (stress-responsive transcriptional regulator)